MELRHSQLVISIGSNISNPRQRLVATLFNNLEITYLNATNGKVWNLKLELNWDILVFLSLLVLNRWEAERSPHHVLLPAWELLDAPNHAALVGHVLDRANI